ncbi:unnamed protein product [Arctogadus glacialis]
MKNLEVTRGAGTPSDPDLNLTHIALKRHTGSAPDPTYLGLMSGVYPAVWSIFGVSSWRPLRLIPRCCLLPGTDALARPQEPGSQNQAEGEKEGEENQRKR